MKKSTKVLIGVAAASVVIIGGVVTAVALQPEPDPTDVLITETVEVRTVTTTVAASGEVRALEQRGVKFAVAGEVLSVDVEEGDEVAEGTVLATVDPADLEAAVASARATVATARDGVAAANLAEAQAQQAINTADLALAQAAEALEAAKDLTSNRGEAIDSAERQIAAAEAQRDTAEYQQARVPAQKVAANATLASALASLEAAEANLDKGVLRAPIAGTIVSVDVEEGDQVSSAGTDLFVLADLGAFEVTASFAEADIVNIEEGQEVNIDFDALPGESSTGTVTNVGLAGQVDPSGGTLTTYEVTVSVANPPAKLRVGMTAQVNIILQEQADIVAAPVAALNLQGEQTIVNVVADDGTIYAVPVEVGFQGGNYVEIVSGLEGGEVVVIGDVGEFPVISGEWDPGSGPPPGVEDRERQQEQFGNE